MKKKFLLWGLFFGILAIILGAFGAHALKSILNSGQLQSFETGVRYQMYHALLLVLLSQSSSLHSKWILNGIVAGVFLFSFSIYLLSLNSFFGIESMKFIGPITPIGGLLLIMSWALLIYKALHLSSSTTK